MSRRPRSQPPMPAASAQFAQDLQRLLLSWYAGAKRDLPWRQSRDPYRIWVSEIMLQQTRVEAVIPYYQRWLERFPTAAVLAEAPEQDVLKAWEGLGYYSRARNLQAAARLLVEHHDGQIPDDPAVLAALPGIGSYTTGAVLSIAYGRPLPAVDGNVLRVLSRLLCQEGDIMAPAVRKGMEQLTATLVPADAAGEFNQALMELGATVCVPQNPRCLACPVATVCQAYAEGRQHELPVRTKAKPPREVAVVAAVVRDPEGRVLVARRPSEGLLGGLWEFPGGDLQAGEPWEQGLGRHLQQRFGLSVRVMAHLVDFTHTFSHLRWLGRAYLCSPLPGQPLAAAEGVEWVPVPELERFPFATAQKRVLNAVRASGGVH